MTRSCFTRSSNAAEQLGVKVVAVHKSIPMGNAPTAPFRPDDIESPAADFPDLNFEIVHGGFTFVEETAFQLARFPNIYVNLEATYGPLAPRTRQVRADYRRAPQVGR